MVGTGAIPAVNTFGANGLLSRRTGGVTGPSVFYSFDPQGNVCQRFGNQGTLLSSDEYDAWGKLLGTTQTGASDVFGAGAQWGYDTESAAGGYLLLTNRYYDPATGRFITRDPIGYAGGINLYAYVGNGAGNFADPLGLFSQQDAAVLGSGVVGGVGGFVASGFDPLGAAFGFAYGAGLARGVLTHDAGAATDEALGDFCVVGTLGEFAGAGASALAGGGLASPAAEDAIAEEAGEPQVGQTVYRVFGGDARGYGRSWTRVNPFTVPNYRDAAGLPSQPGIWGYAGGTLTSGGFVVEGVLTDTTGVQAKSADSLHGNTGGLDELLFESPQAAAAQVRVRAVYGVNPPF